MTDITPGSRIASYEIISLIGTGGMGEVWRARDARISRDVAIKVLPPSVLTDPERLQRFEQEARAAGTLSHPNLVTIHELGTHDGAPFIAMELLEGETLREKLTSSLGGTSSSRRLSLRKATEYATQIAAGLAAAHERGIVHRDLKPENLFVTNDGRVKILDFGLAKLEAPSADDRSDAVTAARPQTAPGIAMGTSGYMSPEQVRGQSVDYRSDIFSFGIVLYEMLSGQRPFRGASTIETLNAILQEDPPDLSETVAEIPPSVARMVRHCLEKSPQERFQSMRDVMFDLESVPSERTSARHSLRGSRKMFTSRFATAILAGLGGLAAGFVLARALAPRDVPPPKLRVLTFSGSDYAPDYSSDGKTMLFVSSRDGVNRIWLKELAGGGEIALTTGSDDLPRFSPDGSAFLFLREEGATSALYRMSTVGGTPRRLLANVAGGADWSPDGRRIAALIVYDVGSVVASKLVILNADGTGARDLRSFSGVNLIAPRWSPGGTWLALSEATSGNNIYRIRIVRNDGREVHTLDVPSAGVMSSIAWVDDERFIYTRAESATGFAGGTGSRGSLCRVGQKTCEVVLQTSAPNQTIDVAGTGKVVYDSFALRSTLSERSLAEASSGKWLTRGNSVDRQPVYSPDGKSILFSSNRSGNLDLWLLSVDDSSIRRITDDAADDFDPAFLPDGRILWSSNRSGHFEIWVANLDGSETRQLTKDGFDAENPTATPDGQWIVYNSYKPDAAGVWKISTDGSRTQRIVAGSTELPEISPDGRYVSYHTTDGTNQVRVVAIGGGSANTVATLEARVSGGPTAPGRSRWVDANHLAFIDLDRAKGIWIVAVQQVDFTQDTSATKRILATGEHDLPVETFDISNDGKRIVVSTNQQVTGIAIAEGVPLKN